MVLLWIDLIKAFFWASKPSFFGRIDNFFFNAEFLYYLLNSC